MASELRVDTLKDSSGNNSVGMAYVSNGSAKAWASYAQATPSILDSNNTSSITDSGAGDYEHNFTSSMSNANYATVAAMHHIGGTGWNAAITVGYAQRVSGAVGVVTANGSDAQADAVYSCTSILGDLA